MKGKILFLGLMLLHFTVFAQEHETEHDVNLETLHETHESHSMKGHHRISLGLGHTHISEGKVDGKNQWIATASWSLNYDYWISNKFAIGLQNDIILETFILEIDEDEVIERKYPISMIPVAIYKPGEHLSLIGGVGAEFAGDKTLTVMRLSAEYGFHLPKSWEIGVAFVWDNKFNYYNSWGISIQISKIL